MTEPPQDHPASTQRFHRLGEQLKSVRWRSRKRDFVHAPVELEAVPPSTDNAVADGVSPERPELEWLKPYADYDWTAAFASGGSSSAGGAPPPHASTSSAHVGGQHRAARAGARRAHAAAAAKPIDPPDDPRAVGGTPCTDVGDGWFKFVDFGGKIYYHHPKERIVTTDDIEDDDDREEVHKMVAEIWKVLNSDGTLEYLPEDCEVIVWNAFAGPKATVAIQCHETSQHFEYDNFTGPDVDESTNTNRYWAYAQEFPMHIPALSKGAVKDFLSALTYGANVGILGDEVLFPYTDAQIEQIMRIWRHQNRVTESNSSPRARASLFWHMARTLNDVEKMRKTAPRSGFHGCRRSAFDMRRVRKKIQTTWQLEMTEYLLVLLLLGAHRMYFGRLKKIRRGKSAYLLDFREGVKQFLAEWTDSNLLATVFIGVNIAFQQVPNITNLQKTASLVSSIFSVLSVATGVHHVWQHRAKVNADFEDAVKYLNHAGDWETVDEEKPGTDLLVISVFLAIPFSALLWSMLSFAIALSALCIQSTSAQALDILAAVLGTLGFLSLLTWLFFRHIWRGSPEEKSVIVGLIRARWSRWIASLRGVGALREVLFRRRRTKKQDEEHGRI